MSSAPSYPIDVRRGAAPRRVAHGQARAWILAFAMAGAALSPVSWASDATPAPGKAVAPSGKPGAPPAPGASPYTPDRFAELVRFSYRVLDPEKAKVLNDKQAEATLDDPKAGVSLVVPKMEKVGQLRQTSAPEAGRSYWMTFSNKGRHVARGDRVDVVIGSFRASNLVVD